MGAEQLRPEIRKTITGLPKLPFHIRPLIPLARFMYNFAAKSNLEEGVKAKTISANGSEVEVYAPTGAKSDAAVLWIYGGGHLAGKPQHLNRIASRVVKEPAQLSMRRSIALRRNILSPRILTIAIIVGLG